MISNLVVSIDIDGVISNFIPEFQRIARQYGVDDNFLTTYNGMWKTKTSDGQNFGKLVMGKHREEWLVNSEPYPEALGAFALFKANPYMDVNIVTARGEDVTDYTMNWLHKHKLFGPVIFEKNKLNVGSQVLIDDKPSLVRDYNENGRMGILVDQPYNREYDAPYRVNNLKEAYDMLNEYVQA